MRLPLPFLTLGLFLGLCRQVCALDRPEITFQVYQFPHDAIPRIDGDASDWARVPDSYAIGKDKLTDDSGRNADQNLKSLDVRVKVGWVKGLNRLYFLYEATDDDWRFGSSSLANDTFELMVDGDASGGPFIDREQKRLWIPEEVGEPASKEDARLPDATQHWAMHGVHAQNYHIFTPSLNKSWAMAWGAPTWIKEFPYANAADRYAFEPGEKGRYTLEFWITPFDYAGPEGPERSVESRLWEDKIVGLSWMIIDYDGPNDRRNGFWRLSSHRMALANASRLCAFRLMPLEPEQISKPRAQWSWTTVDAEKRTVAFKDLSEGKIDTWKWDFGDGTTSAERNPVHSYSQLPKGAIVLEVSGPQGRARMAKLMEISFP